MINISKADVHHMHDFDNHEAVYKIDDEACGLKAFIGVHNRALGPGLGGCRIWRYDSEGEAITDVLRLSQGMTYKSALAGLPLGGGKSVVMIPHNTRQTPEQMRALGRAIQSLNGQYIAAEDVGTSEQDMINMAEECEYISGLPVDEDAVGGNPSPHTAYGVWVAMQQAIKHRYKKDDVTDIIVAVQGLGSVGYDLCRYAHEAGMKLIVSDIHVEKLEQAKKNFGADIVDLDEIFRVDAHVFAPCALGGGLNDITIPELKCGVICGAANNQLAEDRHGEALKARDILYAPDYVVNAGGVICVAYEYFTRRGENPFNHGMTHKDLKNHIEQIASTLQNIFDMADREGITTARAADKLAEEKFKA